MMKFKEISRLAVPAWRWLNINALDLAAEPQGSYGKAPGLTGGDGVVVRESILPRAIPGLSADLEEIRRALAAENNCGLTVDIPPGARPEAPLVIDFLLDGKNPDLADYIHIRAAENSRAAVVIRYRSAGEGACRHSGFTFVDAAPGAEIKLTKAQMLGGRDIHVDATAAVGGEGACCELLLCELGGLRAVAGCNALLAGDAARCALDGLYAGSQDKRLDLNYRMEYRGRNTAGNITVKGALTGRAHKIMKSTIDFMPGAAGARGREEESVLALSDQVVNISAPLLLCGEDDVAGEHATTAGKPDAGKMFYLMSRGFTRREAKQLLVDASFAPFFNKLAPAGLRKDVMAYIREVIHGGE
jgi:Fe-S cluster assembly scaffold protein SufB